MSINNKWSQKEKNTQTCTNVSDEVICETNNYVYECDVEKRGGNNFHPCGK